MLLHLSSLVAVALPWIPLTDAVALTARQDSGNTATVDLSVNKGAPKHLASGFIYGLPDTAAQSQTQIPDHFYKDIGFRYSRAGGAQLDAPARGWHWGLTDYRGRFQSSKAAYTISRKFGANFILLPHDVWGTDTANSSTVWPGDNGDWTDYDKFLNQLLSDLKSNGMITGTVFDIWNEADGSFWARSQQQYLDLYVRTHKRIRQDSQLSSMLITGPSHASQPSADNTWWSNWLQTIKTNNIVPDQYAWHIEGNVNDASDDLQTNIATWNGLLSQYGLPTKQININEYAVFDEQVSAGAAWWISRLERYDVLGLRGNWLSKYQLHDFMASLLTKPNAATGSYSPSQGGYAPNGEYQVYKYYNLNMTGNRVATTGTGDRLMDVYATVGGGKARILTGVRLQTGTWYITIKNLSSVGLPASGTLSIRTWGFIDKGHYGQVDAPTDRGTYDHPYSGNSVTFPVYQTQQDQFTAWAFEFTVAK